MKKKKNIEISVAPTSLTKRHFICNGTGQMCGDCGEASNACQCDESNEVECDGCKGTGFAPTTDDPQTKAKK